MIYLLDQNAPLIFPKNSDPFIKTKILANDLSYGRGFSFQTIWRQEIEQTVTAVLLKFENTFFITASSKADFLEIKEFIFTVGFFSLQTKSTTLKKLGLREHERYICLSKKADNTEFQTLEDGTQLNLKRAYEILFEKENENIKRPVFEGWYADLSHRIRHGTALFEMEGQSACVVSHLTKSSAVISGVATRENARGKGLGSKILNKTLKQLSDKRVYVATSNKTADFYLKNGFKKTENISIYKEL